MGRDDRHVVGGLQIWASQHWRNVEGGQDWAGLSCRGDMDCFDSEGRGYGRGCAGELQALGIGWGTPGVSMGLVHFGVREGNWGELSDPRLWSV